MRRRLRPPEWLLELEGVDGIAVATRPDGWMTVSQKFGNVEILLWGLADRETQPYIRPAAYEALKRPKVIERLAILEAQRKKELRTGTRAFIRGRQVVAPRAAYRPTEDRYGA